MEGLIMTAQILLSLSILVGLHELGHLVAAKAFGIRVEQYSIGFPPKIFGVRYGETEYSIGAIPLGGFVKMFEGFLALLPTATNLPLSERKAVPASTQGCFGCHLLCRLHRGRRVSMRTNSSPSKSIRLLKFR